MTETITREKARELRKEGTFVWRTRDGVYLTVDMIEDDHLLNIELFMIGRSKARKNYNYNPDNDHWQEAYRAVTTEIHRRGLLLKDEDNAVALLHAEDFEREVGNGDYQ